MTPERWQKIEGLLQAALERAPAKRAAFLYDACGADEAMRKEVESLLASNEQVEGFLEMEPNFYLAHLYAGWTYDQKGMHDEAIASIQKAVTLSAGGMLPMGSLAYSLALAGKRDDAKRMRLELGELSERTYVPALYAAVIHAALGEMDDAFQCLERAYDERSNWLTLLKVDPKVDSLRSDSRFADLLRRVGFASDPLD